MKWLRRLAWTIGGLLGLWVLAWLAVPPLLKWQAQERLTQALGRAVSFGEVDFKPWSLELSVRDIAIAGPSAGAPPLLQVARVYVNADSRSLINRAPVIEAFEVDAPAVRLARTAPGRYDIDDLIARLTPTQPAPQTSEPVLFALYNLKVRDAAVTFDDRPVQRAHQLSELQLSLPFLANLPAHIDVKVEPHLSFKVDGTPFDSGAQTTPFAQSRAAALQFSMGDLNIVPYLGYLPESLPVKLRQGRIAAQLELDFAMPPGAAPRVALRGTVGVQDLQVDDRAGQPLLSWKRLDVALSDIKPLDRELAFGAIALDAPLVHVSRDADGRLNLASLATPAAPPAASASAPVVASAPTAAPGAAPPAPWKVRVDSLKLAGLQVRWNDAATAPPAALALESVDLQAGPLAYPFADGATLPVSLQGALVGQAGAAPARLAVEGQVSDRQAQVDVKLAGLSLDVLAQYLAETLAPRVEGRLTASARLRWSAAAGTAAAAAASTAASGSSASAAPTSGDARLTIGEGDLLLEDLRVVEARGGAAGGKAAAVQPALAFKRFAVQGAEIDLAARRVGVSSVRLVEPLVALERNRDGQWNVQRWLKAAPAVATVARGAPTATAEAAASAPAGAPAAAGPDWQVEVRDLAVEGGLARLDDAFVPAHRDGEPVRLELRGLALGVQNLALEGARTRSAASVRLAGRLVDAHDPDRVAGAAAPKGVSGAAGASTTGRFDWRGQLGLQPLAVRGTLKVDRLPVHAFESYYRERLPIALPNAEAGVQAEVTVRERAGGHDIGLTGDLLLADVRVNSRPGTATREGLSGSDELLSWQSFALKGVTLALAPDQVPRIDITEAALNDFYSRLVITEDGRFNLQDIGPAEPAPDAGSSAASAAAPRTEPAASAPAPAASGASPATAPTPAFALSVGSTRLTNGRVDFTDRFVRPNYSADLSELNGSLGAFRSGTREMATIELRGRAARTALLEITGQLNPTAEPLALNIRAKATDLELAPLSPYAGKYAGYAIERGKLSMDVSYAISADGKLEAKNQVILNQLTFGERIESPTATSLPVLLAVALLKDRHGVIDINLPISGSLNDPQFSIGGIIFKVIVNLITKALTAPFSLLFGGGGEDMSQVEFKPGMAAFSEGGASALDQVAKALLDRPSLKMTVTGASDPAAERDDYLQATLEARLLQEKKKELARAGGAEVVASAASAASGPASAASGVLAPPLPPPPPALSAEERERLLKAVYRQTDLPDKPRNLVGLQKDLPAAEMEERLKAAIVVTDDAMRELALQRGLAVRDALIAKGLPSERLFIASPKLRAPGDATDAWKPAAKLALTNN